MKIGLAIVMSMCYSALGMMVARMPTMNSNAPNPGRPWITVPEYIDCEKISRNTAYTRMAANSVVWREVNGKREIDPLSMTFDGQQRWRRKELEKAAKRNADPEQLYLLPQTPLDREIALVCASLPKPQAAAGVHRFQLLQPALNDDSRAMGYKAKAEFIRQISKQAGVHERTIWRWIKKYRKTGSIAALANERPGPEIGTGSVLDTSMKAHVQTCWEIEKRTRADCYKKLIGYLTGKQIGCGVGHIYEVPHRTTVYRFINTVLQGEKNPLRGGPDLLHAYSGYMDRTFTDLDALERVETDEWKTDVLVYEDSRPKNLRRFWLLIFYDCRSMYPLTWDLVAGSEYKLRHGIGEEDEINLLVRLVREYGIPAALHSDRGRFRGKLFGGKPLGKVIDEKFACVNGILDQLGIRHNMPRIKNPRGTREERFNRFLADSCRTVPGWIGANTKQRKMAPGDEQQAQHEEWLRGKRQATPLLSHSQFLEHINAWMENWRDHESDGTDMRGLSPRAVFLHSTPAEGFKRISEEQLALATAQHFENETIESGGIITLRDNTRYSHPLLSLIQGEQREVVRLRSDHAYISVLPAQKGEEVIIAPRRVRVGTSDPDELSRQSAMQGRLEKLHTQFGQRPASKFPAVPITKERVNWQEPEPVEIRAEALDACEEHPAPSLYELKEITAEEL